MKHEEIPGNVVCTKDDGDVEEEMVAFDTCLQPVDIAQEVLDHYFDDVYSIAPGEGNNQFECYRNLVMKLKHFLVIFQLDIFHGMNKDKKD